MLISCTLSSPFFQHSTVTGWDSARFLELVLNDGGFPLRELVLPIRPHQDASRRYPYPPQGAFGRVLRERRPLGHVVTVNNSDCCW